MTLSLQKLWNTSIVCFRCLSRTYAYKSIYNIENLYPASQDIYSTFSSKSETYKQWSKNRSEDNEKRYKSMKKKAKKVVANTMKNSAEKELNKMGESKNKNTEGDFENFNGEIPIKKLQVRYSKSSGPGGQHVNTTMTKVQMRFHVMSADWMSEGLRSDIVKKFRRRITKNGELVVWNDDSRYQLQNTKNCLDEIKEIIKKAEEPPDTSKEERIAELNNMESIQAAHKKRLLKKKQRGLTKSMRTFVE